jgi:cytochrome b6-f complex iron-sulfur subunit
MSAGNVSSLSVGSLKIVGNAVLGRDAGGLYAMSNVCTHEGCLMNVVGNSGAESLYCNCHGSAFSATGAVTHGPARTALPHYQVDVAADGSITIQGGQEVASTVRTPVG